MAVRVETTLPDERRFWPSARHVRAKKDGAVVVDSRAVLLVWEPGKPVPFYAFPEGDVAAGIRTRRWDDAELQGYVRVPWSDADHWYEEDEEVFVHPRDPFKRVDAIRSSRHVVVTIGGEVVADSHRPVLVFETSLPTRHYFPRDDVRMDLLEPSARKTGCAYKGTASYWSVGDERDVAWCYPESVVPAIEGLVAFFEERVDLTVDGERQERPVTQWSRR